MSKADVKDKTSKWRNPIFAGLWNNRDKNVSAFLTRSLIERPINAFLFSLPLYDASYYICSSVIRISQKRTYVLIVVVSLATASTFGSKQNIVLYIFCNTNCYNR